MSKFLLGILLMASIAAQAADNTWDLSNPSQKLALRYAIKTQSLSFKEAFEALIALQKQEPDSNLSTELYEEWLSLFDGLALNKGLGQAESAEYVIDRILKAPLTHQIFLLHFFFQYFKAEFPLENFAFTQLQASGIEKACATLRNYDSAFPATLIARAIMPHYQHHFVKGYEKILSIYKTKDFNVRNRVALAIALELIKMEAQLTTFVAEISAAGFCTCDFSSQLAMAIRFLKLNDYQISALWQANAEFPPEHKIDVEDLKAVVIVKAQELVAEGKGQNPFRDWEEMTKEARRLEEKVAYFTHFSKCKENAFRLKSIH